MFGAKKHIASNPCQDNASNATQPVFFQPKLSINQPGDEYEKEANDIADRVIRMKTDSPSSQFFKPSNGIVQRKCAHCEEEKKEKEKLQRKESSDHAPATSNSLNNYVGTLSSKGSPLSSSTRNFFESRMGYDFSQVKIHNDDVASKSAASINALAYTTGNNIVFRQNQYSPETDSGKKLLAHELTHVIQQHGGQSSGIQKYDDPSKWCHAFNTLIVYEAMHGKIWTLYRYNSFTTGIIGDETLIPLNHNIPSILGDVDMDWMFRLAVTQYAFYISGMALPSLSEYLAEKSSRAGQIELKAFWNTIRAPFPEWNWEYESIFETGNWNAAPAITQWLFSNMSLADLFAPAVKLC